MGESNVDIISNQNEDIAADFIMMKYPYLGILIAGFYLLLVLKILPKFMENRPAYKLKTVLLVYNAYQVYICSHIVISAISFNTLGDYILTICEHVPPLGIPSYNAIAYISWVYLWVKILDLFDTVFIVLKKKEKQLTFLHLFHHTMVVSIAIVSFSDREKIGYPIIIINSFVHVIMYSYYLLSSFDSMKWTGKYKRFVTQLQLAQFFFFLIYFVTAQYYGCPWGTKTAALWYFTLMVLIYQFSKFYYLEYMNRRGKSMKKEK